MVPFVTYCSMRQRPSPLNYFVDRMAGNDATASPDCDATRSNRSSRPYCANHPPRGNVAYHSGVGHPPANRAPASLPHQCCAQCQQRRREKAGGTTPSMRSDVKETPPRSILLSFWVHKETLGKSNDATNNLRAPQALSK